jgi:hypothetical protein
MSEASDDSRRATEQILRRAEAQGLDTERVARALGHRPALPDEYQAVEQVKPQSWFRRRFARGFARPPS